jgi:DNA-binding HxlR family transcriptional regulator
MDKLTLETVANCPVTATMDIIGGKWKILILYMICNDINRFGKMGMVIKGISKQMLTTQLRELEVDGILERKIYPEIPPRVEYFLTEKGKSLIPILELMADWGNEHIIKSYRGHAIADKACINN